MPPLDSHIKCRIIVLANGTQESFNGMEKHFVGVVNGIGRACTPLEKEWVIYWETYQKGGKEESRNEPEIVPKSVHRQSQRRKSQPQRAVSKHILGTALPPRVTVTEHNLCADCDREIPAARLSVNPTAVRCISCQGKLEDRSSGIGTRSIDEGIGSTREDNKRMRAKNWGDMRNRGK